MIRYNYTTYSVPLLCITDCSWPIIKSLIGAFNNKTLEQYIFRSFQIVSGNATNDTLPIKICKTFVHISLCHSMKAFCRKIDQLFKKEKKFIKYCMSVIVNTGGLSDIFVLIKHLFRILLSPYSVQCDSAKSSFEEKIVNIENYKKEYLNDISRNEPETFDDIFEDSENPDLPTKGETYLQQSKRSIYYQKCKSLFLEELKNIKKQAGDTPDSREVNLLFSREYAMYFLNNWSGLLPLWSSLHLGDQGRHGHSDVYKLWSAKFRDRECIRQPPRTQGIVEFHHKSVKHITMNSKRERIDSVIGNLFRAKKSKF